VQTSSARLLSPRRHELDGLVGELGALALGPLLGVPDRVGAFPDHGALAELHDRGLGGQDTHGVVHARQLALH
jgi:hypothetical protein